MTVNTLEMRYGSYWNIAYAPVSFYDVQSRLSLQDESHGHLTSVKADLKLMA